MRTYWLTCVGCHQKFEAKRDDAQTCSPKCRKRKSRRPAELKEMYQISVSYINQIGLEMQEQKRGSSRRKPNFKLREYLKELRELIDSYMYADDV